jgi:hypothetical protein
MLAFADNFWIVAVVFAAMVPIVFVIKKTAVSEAAEMI